MAKVRISGLPKKSGDALKKVRITKVPKAKNGKWIQKAINPAHKGYCTPMTKATCTPARKAFAKRAKAHKLQDGGNLPVTEGLPESMHQYANIEAEGGEVYQNQSGGIVKINDQSPDHEQGGVKIPDAQRVLEDTSTKRKDIHSKRLKMSPNEVDTIFGFKPKKPLSHAETFEFTTKEFAKSVDTFNRKLKNTDEEPRIGKFGANTARLNMMHRDSVPSKQDVFNTLFDHQEAIKEVHDIPDDGSNKYGGFKPRIAQFGAGPKANTAQGEFTTTGQDVNQNPNVSLDDYKKKWKEAGLDLSGYKTTREAQAATYQWLAKNNPDTLKDMWKSTGLTNMGRANIDKIKKLGIDVGKNSKDKYGRLDVKNWDDLTPDQLAGLGDLAYADNNFRIRTLIPSTETTSQGQPGQQGVNPPAQGTPFVPKGSPGVNINPNFKNQPPNNFNEPTHWYDVAPSAAELTDSLTRDPELYNPVQIHQVKYKLMNPTGALNANESDYNAALKSLQYDKLGPGSSAANVANLTAQKYKANNQISGQYENENAQIQNREIDYNTNAKDRQSMADANSRATFYGNVLKARDNQRLQKLQAIQDISRVQQLKARQNRSGNLILKMTPAFNQKGEYSGYQYGVTLLSDLGYGTEQPKVKGKTTQTSTSRIGNRIIKQTTTSPYLEYQQ